MLGWSLMAGEVRAQAPGPAFLFQPGMLTTDFLSAPDDLGALTGFNLRFVTTVPTRYRWLTLTAGASVTPYGAIGAFRRDENTPVLFGGNVFPILTAGHTSGWLSVDAPLLLVYSFGGGGDRETRVYGRDVVGEVAVTLHVGRKLLSGFGSPLSRLRVYGLLDQNLTPNRDFSGRRDRFNPIAQYGLTVPFGTGRDSP
jgi:hypothetical protein